MNKVVLKKDGQLHINGTEISMVTGFSMKATADGLTSVIVEFDASNVAVEVGVADFSAGVKPQSETSPRNAIIQKMMEIGLTYKEAMAALENSKTLLTENLGTYATDNDPLFTALCPDWRG